MYLNCSFDQQESCNRVLHPGRLPARGVSQELAGDSCLYGHISTNPLKNPPPGNFLNRKSTNYTKLNTTRYQGSAASSYSSDFWGIYKADVYRTSIKFHRMVRGPQFINRNPPFEDYKIDAIQNYLGYSGLRVLSEEEISRNCTTRGKIDSFSRKSAHNLKHLCSNCSPKLISGHVLTYPDSCIPTDGRISKRHLNSFLTSFRKKFPLAHYLWVLEFHKDRPAPHYHIHFSFRPSEAEMAWLVSRWVSIISPVGKDIEHCRWWHCRSKNNQPWDMKKGGYLAYKYLSKESQKNVPPGFLDVGRFWGTTRGLAPSPECIDLSQLPQQTEEIDPITGEITTYDYNKTLLRAIRRHHEASIRSCFHSVLKKYEAGIVKKKPTRNKKKSRITNLAMSSVYIPSGGLVYQKHLRWWYSMTYKNHEEAPF